MFEKNEAQVMMFSQHEQGCRKRKSLGLVVWIWRILAMVGFCWIHPARASCVKEDDQLVSHVLVEALV